MRLPGLLRLHAAEPWLGVRWQGESDTVGGYITERLGRLPIEGERFTIDGVEVEVERVADHAVASLLSMPVVSAAEATDE